MMGEATQQEKISHFRATEKLLIIRLVISKLNKKEKGKKNMYDYHMLLVHVKLQLRKA